MFWIYATIRKSRARKHVDIRVSIPSRWKKIRAKKLIESFGYKDIIIHGIFKKDLF